MKTKVLLIALISFAMSGCGEMGPGQIGGGVLGGGLGALMGSQIGGGRGKLVATALGAVLGSQLGGFVGKKFDDKDKAEASAAANQSLSTGQNVSWVNPQSGHRGQFISQPVQHREGRKFRQFSHLVYIDGKPTEVHGTAYQNPDGSWQIVN